MVFLAVFIFWASPSFLAKQVIKGELVNDHFTTVHNEADESNV